MKNSTSESDITAGGREPHHVVRVEGEIGHDVLADERDEEVGRQGRVDELDADEQPGTAHLMGVVGQMRTRDPR